MSETSTPSSRSTNSTYARAASGSSATEPTSSSGCCPAGQRLVDRLGVVEVALVRREVARLGAVPQPVARADRQLVERREDVELRQRERRDPVHAHRVAQRDEVEPAAAALAAGHRAELAAELADALLVGPLDLRRERPFADARDVRLRDADDRVDPVRADADAGRRVRRRPGSTR